MKLQLIIISTLLLVNLSYTKNFDECGEKFVGISQTMFDDICENYRGFTIFLQEENLDKNDIRYISQSDSVIFVTTRDYHCYWFYILKPSESLDSLRFIRAW